ncbi:hypothetical protein BIT28_07380 [Photobacterium proteolyticum]|uniref:Uncharacterized protein n=1 Tax=Photobacterium proteolyticum TaxID=1903952 RepID=A0A1Q9H7I3_9GAMM|nr:hypothetical protein [Photobacterium proteolyticum]OLQ83943.1 hypothetical protein BIT28_07380 [Photobacterium proteolyticum]
MAQFIQIKLIEDLVTDISGQGEFPTIGLSYNENNEAYINRYQIQYFNVDENNATIEINFPPINYELFFVVKLKFSDKGGEFQRIKRELLS